MENNENKTIITTKWIKKNFYFVEKTGIANGVGGKNSFFTKCFKFLLFLIGKKKSMFYHPAMIHDVLYWAGNSEDDRIRADLIFLKEMLLKLDRENKFQKNTGGNFKYYKLRKIQVYIFYFAVRTFGFAFFNYRNKNYVEDMVIELGDNDLKHD